MKIKARVCLIAILLLLVLLAILPAPALASGQPGPTPTFNPPAACAGGETYILNDGRDMCVERSFTWGEVFVGLAVLGVVAMLGLRMLYDMVFIRWLS